MAAKAERLSERPAQRCTHTCLSTSGLAGSRLWLTKLRSRSSPMLAAVGMADRRAHFGAGLRLPRGQRQEEQPSYSSKHAGRKTASPTQVHAGDKKDWTPCHVRRSATH